MSLFGELRKRHLLEITLLYMGAGWLCIEITDFIVSTYGFSRKILDTVVFLAILGLPAFVVIGWYHGEKGSQRVRRAEMWLLVTLMALGAIGTYRIVTGEETSAEAGAAGGKAPAAITSGDALPASSADLPDLGQRSLAVLPFKNNIADHDLAWLGTGLADLLTTNFAQIPDMRVVGRQTLYDLLTEEGRSEDEAIPESLALTVARGAGARMLLWGSVTGTADDMRIDAQLVELENGTVVFGEHVRGSDVFALVDSLTLRLAERLQGQRPPPRIMRISQLGTRDMDAFRAFQQGIAAERAGRLEEAEAHFEEAASIDSTFVLPLARLASRDGPGEVRSVGVAPGDFDPDDVEIEELARAAAAGYLTDRDVEEIARAAGWGPEEMAELQGLRAAAAERSAAMHRGRAVRLFERMGSEWAAQVEGMSEGEFLARLDSTIGKALTRVEVVMRSDMPPDSLVLRPRPPREEGSTRPDSTRPR